MPDDVEREDFFDEPFIVVVPPFLDAPEFDFVEAPESERPDFLAPRAAVRLPADPLFGLSFCLLAKAVLAVLFFEAEPDALAGVFDAPVSNELELFADLLVPDPPVDLVADRELPVDAEPAFEPVAFFAAGFVLLVVVVRFFFVVGMFPPSSKRGD